MLTLTLYGWAVTAVFLALMWWRQTRTLNATSVDVAWSASLCGFAIYYALRADGELARRVIAGAIAGLWALRLTIYLLRARVLGREEEDGRYVHMREVWGARVQPVLFLFYQGQAFVAALFSVPFLYAMTRPGPLDALDAAGLAVAVLAIAGEALADGQLARWRADPQNRGKTCRAGLWRYSRHPNYFFEWLHWFAYVLIGGGAWPTWLGPALMLLFLFRFTGIPYTERQALRSRGDDYREYQRTTSVFVPWFPRMS